MEKLQRNGRIAAIAKILADSPGRAINLGSFSDVVGSAKSSISEDLDIIRHAFEKFGFGTVETIPGASGGVRFLPATDGEQVKRLAEALCTELSRRERILPGGYLYTLDVIYNPELVNELGKVIAGRFYGKGIDYVITVETKGIPLAFAAARYLNTPLIVVRHYNEASDGASVNINYISGSSKKMQTMVLPLKSLKRNSRLLFVDDFMKGGGTAKGIIELAREFECSIAGTCIFIQTAEPARKLVDSGFSFLTLYNVDEEKGIVDLRPSAAV